MAYSINRRPLLAGVSDSEFDDDFETEVDDPRIQVDDVKPIFKVHEPSDKYNAAYIIFYLLGMTTLIPWTFFVTPEDYWMYKFRENNMNGSTGYNDTGMEILEKRSDLQASFMSYLNVASAVPNTIFLIVNTFISKKISLRIRMVGSQIVILILFICTTVLVDVNTDNHQNDFFIVTMTTVVAINVAAAIFGGSVMGVAGRFSSKYITAMMGGQALGGIFAGAAEVVSLWVGASPVVSGLIYFIIGDAMILITLIAYIFLEQATFFKYHLANDSSGLPIDSGSSGGDPTDVHFLGQGPQKISYVKILRRMWHYGVSNFIVFVVTLSVYPAVTVLVDSHDKGNGHPWNDIYFVPVVSYLLFSTADYLGRILAGILQWPKNRPWLVIFLSLLRVFFVPAILLCNAQPRHHLPVYINQDIYYILITLVFAFTNGYICNIVLVFTPTVVDPADREVASAMMAAFLGIGLAVGSAVSLVLVKIL